MPIADLILAIQHATGPVRALDNEIALAIGYKKKTTRIKAANGHDVRKIVWLNPANSAEKPRAPHFTGSLDAAQLLALTLVPGCAAAFTWGGEFSTARIDDGPRFSAANPMLALCVAALNAVFGDYKNEGRGEQGTASW
jgi:hypothetical protein